MHLPRISVPLTAHAQDKRLKSWGNNRSGQLADDTRTDFLPPATAVLGPRAADDTGRPPAHSYETDGKPHPDPNGITWIPQDPSPGQPT